jgi:hypothetical protein
MKPYWNLPMIRNVLQFLAITLFSVVATGCREKPATGGTEPPEANVPVIAIDSLKLDGGKERPKPNVQAVAIDSLKFDTPELQKRFKEFDTAARQFAGKDFDYQPPQLGGNFVQEVWAKGIGFTEPCELRGPREAFKGIHRISVDTIVVPFPQAKAAAVAVVVVAPDPNSWCVLFAYRESTHQEVTGPGWWITFYRWNPDRLGSVPFLFYDQAKERITLPIRNYSVRDSGVGLSAPPSILEDFVQHARSARAMRDVYLANLAQLEKLARAFIQEHKAQKKVYDKDTGSGLPPLSHLEPLTAEEEKEELAKAKQFFSAQTKFMEDHHEALYAAWRKSFPLENCWPEVGKE